MLRELRRRVVEDVARVDFRRRDLERLGAVLLGQREVGVVEELQGVFIILVEVVREAGNLFAYPSLTSMPHRMMQLF